MKFLTIGCGSIGQKHISNLKWLGHDVYGCETDFDRAEKVRKKYAIEVFLGLEEALKFNYDGALICTPTKFHVSIAIEIARRGIALFIEKPLSDTLEQIEELTLILKEKQLISLVGCNTRFLPSLQLAKQLIENNEIGKVLSVRGECGFYLPYWHPEEDYRKEYSANKSLGGGVIFDDIHEIDLLYWMFGKVEELFCFSTRVSQLEIDTEDLAEIFFKFKSGMIAQIHLDYIQRTYRKSYKFIGESGVVVWDYIKQRVEMYSAKTNQHHVFEECLNVSHNVMMIEEMKHFVNCIRENKKSMNDAFFATDVLKLALACHESSDKKVMITI